MKSAALQLQLTAEQIKRLEKCAGKINADSRAAFAELALDFTMPLIEAGKMVNLNGKLIFSKDAAEALKVA